MRFHRLHEGVEALKEQVARALAEVLVHAPHERIIVNFSKYEKGDFLGSHTDTPSGSESYDRREAFVWHLSEGWERAHGGLFVDEEAEGGPRHLVPAFNSLVTFPVPRWHAVTEVTAAGPGQARFAAYGWVTVPRIAQLSGLPGLLTLLRRQRKGAAVAVLCVSEPLGPPPAEALALFAALPFEAVGRHTLGELCTFAATGDPVVALLLGVPEAVGAALAVLADPAAAASQGACIQGGQSGLASCRVCADLAVLRSPAGLRRFLDAARKVFSPCPELDFQDSRLMADMFFSEELKVFVFLPRSDRSPAASAKLDAWADVLQPGIRIFLAEPEQNGPIMEDFGLTPADAPTAVADDTAGPLGRFHLGCRLVLARERLDLEPLRRWLEMLASRVATARTTCVRPLGGQPLRLPP